MRDPPRDFCYPFFIPSPNDQHCVSSASTVASALLIALPTYPLSHTTSSFPKSHHPPCSAAVRKGRTGTASVRNSAVTAGVPAIRSSSNKNASTLAPHPSLANKISLLLHADLLPHASPAPSSRAYPTLSIRQPRLVILPASPPPTPSTPRSLKYLNLQRASR